MDEGDEDFGSVYSISRCLSWHFRSEKSKVQKNIQDLEIKNYYWLQQQVLRKLAVSRLLQDARFSEAKGDAVHHDVMGLVYQRRFSIL